MERELGARLLAVAEAIPQCESLVDCGCDHAYVSIYAAQMGKVNRITASDINRGPLENAKSEIAAAGFSDKIETVLTDGLCGLTRHDCVVIAGMGGETIAEIISKTPWTKDSCTLVLQPMTKLDILREFLYNEGFEIFKENIVAEGERIYCIISARYKGDVSYLPYEKYISRSALCEKLAKQYTDSVIKRLENELKSRMDADVITDDEKEKRECDLASLREMRGSL